MKYECIYLHGHDTLTALRRELVSWFDRYNGWHPHEHLGNPTPSKVYESQEAAA